MPANFIEDHDHRCMTPNHEVVPSVLFFALVKPYHGRDGDERRPTTLSRGRYITWRRTKRSREDVAERREPYWRCERIMDDVGYSVELRRCIRETRKWDYEAVQRPTT